MAAISQTIPEPLPEPSWWRRVATFFYTHPNLSLALLLLLPLGWLVIIYLGSISAMMVQSFFYVDDFSGRIVREFSLRTYQQLFTPAHLDIVGRTVTMAAAVSLASAVIAFPRRPPPSIRPGASAI